MRVPNRRFQKRADELRSWLLAVPFVLIFVHSSSKATAPSGKTPSNAQLAEMCARLFSEVNELRSQVERLTAEVETLRSDQRATPQHEVVYQNSIQPGELIVETGSISDRLVELKFDLWPFWRLQSQFEGSSFRDSVKQEFNSSEERARSDAYFGAKLAETLAESIRMVSGQSSTGRVLIEPTDLTNVLVAIIHSDLAPEIAERIFLLFQHAIADQYFFRYIQAEPGRYFRDSELRYFFEVKHLLDTRHQTPLELDFGFIQGSHPPSEALLARIRSVKWDRYFSSEGMRQRGLIQNRNPESEAEPPLRLLALTHLLGHRGSRQTTLESYKKLKHYGMVRAALLEQPEFLENIFFQHKNELDFFETVCAIELFLRHHESREITTALEMIQSVLGRWLPVHMESFGSGLFESLPRRLAFIHRTVYPHSPHREFDQAAVVLNSRISSPVLRASIDRLPPTRLELKEMIAEVNQQIERTRRDALLRTHALRSQFEAWVEMSQSLVVRDQEGAHRRYLDLLGEMISRTSPPRLGGGAY